MRHALANLALATTTLAGCSLLYNPNDLPAQADAMPDMQMVIDANPAALAINGVGPIAIIEGQGDGNSRKPVIVIEGTDIAQTATVEIVASPGATKTPMLALDTASQQVDVYGHHIAIAVTAPVDTALGAGEVISLDVVVTQDAGGTPVSKTLSGILTLQGRAEWENTGGTIPALAEGVNKFSRVNLTMGTIARTTGPVIVEATASINITDVVVANFDGTSTTAGPGGNNGGAGAAAQLATASAGADGAGAAGGDGGATAGNPAMQYMGDDQLTTINTVEKLANSSSGGGGGGVPAVSLRPGGRGGGGGGTVAFTAGGSISLGNTISAKGSAGQSGGDFANAGGAGSGGIILLRGGGDVTTAALDVGGPGPVGRVRIDAGGVITTPAGAYHRGPTFVNLPLIINEEKPTLVVQGAPSKGLRYIVIRGTDIEGPIELTMGADGRAMITLQRPLQQGINEICLLVEAAPAATYTRNCATVAHIYKTP